MMWEQPVTARTGSVDPGPMREEEWTKKGRPRIGHPSEAVDRDMITIYYLKKISLGLFSFFLREK